MTTTRHDIAQAAIAGALVGACMAITWLRPLHDLTPQTAYLPSPLADNALALQTFLFLGAVALAGRIFFPTRESITLAIAALLTSTFVPIAAAAASTAITQGTSIPLLWLAPVGLPFLLRALIMHDRRSIAVGALLVLIPVSSAFPISFACPPDLTRATLAYDQLPLVHSYLVILPRLAVAGSVAGTAVGYLLAYSSLRAAATGAAAGSGVALLVCISHTLAALALMQSGRSWQPMAAQLVLFWAALAVAIVLSRRAWISPHASVLVRIAPLALCVIVVARLAALGFGASVFSSLRGFHPDHQYTYVHFQSNGIWQRTVDTTGNSTRLWRCERFLATYPNSPYRPAALLQLAECQYEVWDFAGAADTLQTLSEDYPAFRGYPDLLRMCALSAAGDARDVVRLAVADPNIGVWARGQGALVAAAAARCLCMPNRALGFYNAHIEFLHGRQPTLWTAAAAQFASDRADDALNLVSSAGARLGNVRVRVLASGRPLANARIVLVQPHHDAAFPTDSQLFTGAWSLPAWNGMWAQTDRAGWATLCGVPYGQYELVLGLDLPAARAGFVVSSWVPPVAVDAPVTVVAPISLVRSVELISPKPWQSVSQAPRLSWKAVPNAAHYAVSLVVLDEPHPRRAVTAGKTCWARARITSTSVDIGPGYFSNPHSRLKKGGYYMWIVYAVGKDGRLISSSEHYAQTHEPAFQVK